MWWGLGVLAVLIYVAAPGALHEAALNGNLTTLKELVSKIPPSDVQSALTQCYQKPSGNSACFNNSGEPKNDVCSYFKVFVDECVSVLDAAAFGRQPAVVQYLLTDLKAQPNWKHGANRTALHYAFASFTVYWHPCADDFRKTVLALLEGGDSLVTWLYGQFRAQWDLSCKGQTFYGNDVIVICLFVTALWAGTPG
jgi:hypothetical protein